VALTRVTVIGGTGDEGFGLAARWAKAGIPVVIGSRNAARAKEAATRLEAAVPGADGSGLENPEAAAASDVVVVTVPFAGQAPIYKSIAGHLSEGAVVIDATVPVAAAVGGRSTRVLGVWEGSAAQQAQALLPPRVRLCAAFHTLSASAVNDLAAPLEGDVLVAGVKEAKPVVRELIEAIEHLRFVDAGPLDQARIIEPLTALLIGINRRYGTDRAGIRITGLPD
jgi:NADPH-dependent F420 reductase